MEAAYNRRTSVVKYSWCSVFHYLKALARTTPAVVCVSSGTMIDDNWDATRKNPSMVGRVYLAIPPW